MSRKQKRQGWWPFGKSDLGPRIERANQEGRYQQALELTKQLYKEEPTPAHKEQLRNTYLNRARQLRNQGNHRDAVNVLNVGLQLDGAPKSWLEQVAQELTACGAGQQALALMSRISPDPGVWQKVLNQAADTAMARGPAAQTDLLPELTADFHRIGQASAQIEAGQDEPARQTLQEIGLHSPFLEWKLLLRGLMAYYQKDDERALENWQRLNPERLPARVAAPLRFSIDPSFRAAQSPQAQALLQKQVGQLQHQDLPRLLRQVQQALHNQDSLARAFRLAADLLPQLRQDFPQVVPRLASCFYWGIITNGQPEDVQRYQRVFGSPADDLTFARLEALALENVGDMEEAHQEWQRYDRWVADHPTVWPNGQTSHVRSLIWKRMGLNAAAVPDLADLPPFSGPLPRLPPPLHPTAEECFKRSLELAPDQLDTHEKLVHFYLDKGKDQKAEKAARKLLEFYPNHVATLKTLAHLRVTAQDFTEGIQLLERALQANPLDAQLRQRLSTTHIFQARAFTEAGRFDEARAEFRLVLSLDQSENSALFCKMAACEFKAGNVAQAEDYLQKALAAAGSHLSAAFSMLIEVIRLKLPGKLKTRFNKDFNALLKQPADGATAVALAETAAAHQAMGINYHGQKTHEKKVLGYLQKAVTAELTEFQLEKTCEALLTLKSRKLLQDFALRGRRQFRQNPYFPFWQAETFIMQGPHRCPSYRVGPLLNEVRRLAAAMPPGSRKEQLLEEVQRREDMISVLRPFGGIDFDRFSDLLDQYGGFEDEDDF